MKSMEGVWGVQLEAEGCTENILTVVYGIKINIFSTLN